MSGNKDSELLKKLPIRTVLIMKILFVALSLLAFLFSGCSIISNLKGKQTAEQSIDSGKSTEAKSSETTAIDTSVETAAQITLSSDSSTTNTSESSGASQSEQSSTSTSSTETSSTNTSETTTADTANPENNSSDLSSERKLFTEGVAKFEDGSYIEAEYYFNKIKYSYKVLGDHVLYYLAKSLLMQKKFDLAKEYYQDLKSNYPDSIFNEKAALEYADLFYMQQDYAAAETQYKNFLVKFAGSELVPYGLFQLGVCQENNSEYSEAAENYKTIWLNYPESEYSENAYTNIANLVEKKLADSFTPTNDQIYHRGELLFNLYLYDSALKEFNKILENGKTSSVGVALNSKTLFKMGMCYFNFRDYSNSRDYLLRAYESSPTGNFADDSLFFLGRAYTSLGQNDSAIKYYRKLIKNFPQSNYADDSYYRIGRIYFLNNDFGNAAASYKAIIDGYPGADKISDAYWEYGWIQYREGDFNSAKVTFSSMAEKFKGSQLGEKASFWQAKSCEKLDEKDNAISLFKNIVKSEGYDYYTFASQKELENLGTKIEIPALNTSVFPDNPNIDEILPAISSDAGSNGAGSSVAGIKFTHIDKAKELLNLEFYASAAKEIGAGSKEFESSNMKILEISTLYYEARDYTNAQKLINKYLSKLNSNLSSPYTDYIYYLLYPYGFKEYIDKYSEQFGVDPLFVLAVIREESRFQPDAGSFAGALGLMQIMPKTGKAIAGQLGIPNFKNSMLLDPETSIKMGAYYLGAQLGNFSQNKYYASGAYNGGPGSMSSWISKWGDKDIDEFIEYVSYDETRNYIKKVMGSYFFYQMLYPGK